MKNARITRRTSPLMLSAALLAAGALHGPTSAHAQSAPPKAPTGQPPGGPSLSGTIKSASSSLLTISSQGGHTAKVHLSSATTYMVNGKSSKTQPKWKVGERVQIMGAKRKDGSYTAQAIMVGTPPAPPQGAGSAPPSAGGTRIDGTVVSSSHSSLTVRAKSGARSTVTISSSTHFMVNGRPASKEPTFKSGQTVHVLASKSGKTLTAQLVAIGSLPQGPGGPPPGGQG